MNAEKALEQLKQGNVRYRSGVRGRGLVTGARRRAEIVEAQYPIAVILGCSDSRVPVETVFDQGLGDLFVVRVAGNVAGTTQIGSVEFAVQYLGTRLVVVLGHTNCGALQATIAGLEQRPDELSEHLLGIVRELRPAVETVVDADLDGAAKLQAAVRANALYSARRLLAQSPVLADTAASDGLMVVAAEYSLESGEVTYLDEPVEPGAGPGGS